MNELIIYAIIFMGGMVIGVAVTIIITRIYKPYYKQDILSISGEIQKNLAAFTDTSMQASVQQLVNMSEQVVAKHTQLGEQNIENKKQLIDQSIQDVKNGLKELEQLVNNLERERASTFGQLSEQLRFASEQTLKLQETTGKLQLALGNSRVRGQWGERMADDILRAVGFIENINYFKQRSADYSGNRPDYTFLLPNNLQLNMDVKFPLDNYLKYVNCDSETDRANFAAAFLKDTRQRIKEVTTREYINPEQNTVDYVLVMIPNEQVYRFINENDPSILDEALRNKVVLCSPVTLYAILALVRQAVENFKMEKAVDEILSTISLFQIQWQKFVESMDKMGKKLQEAQNEYTNLITTRRSKLEKPLNRIDEIRRERGIEELQEIESDFTVPENNADNQTK
jgi:DNA recombination protein RmuC